MPRKPKDYYRQLAEQEKRSAEIKKEVDRDFPPTGEDRREIMANRIKRLRENE